jgi:hypothetical protein
MLEASEVVRPREHLGRRAVELAQSVDDLGRRLAGVLLAREEAPVEALEATVDTRIELAEAAIELFVERGQAALDKCPAGASENEEQTAKNGEESDECECVCHWVYKR